ncbi:MAG: hypothetical protein ACLSVD_13170 [Eggerthellaceae bacterium]
MIEQKYSVTRTRATWSPRIADDDLPFYRCPECGRVLQESQAASGSFSDGLRNPMAEPPMRTTCRPSRHAAGARLSAWS